jgi:hypothetical protein
MSGFHESATRRPPRSSLPFARLTESERLAQDLAALTDAGLIMPVASGEDTRYELIERPAACEDRERREVVPSPAATDE